MFAAFSILIADESNGTESQGTRLSSRFFRAPQSSYHWRRLRSFYVPDSLREWKARYFMNISSAEIDQELAATFTSMAAQRHLNCPIYWSKMRYNLLFFYLQDTRLLLIPLFCDILFLKTKRNCKKPGQLRFRLPHFYFLPVYSIPHSIIWWSNAIAKVITTWYSTEYHWRNTENGVRR